MNALTNEQAKEKVEKYLAEGLELPPTAKDLVRDDGTPDYLRILDEFETQISLFQLTLGAVSHHQTENGELTGPAVEVRQVVGKGIIKSKKDGNGRYIGQTQTLASVLLKWKSVLEGRDGINPESEILHEVEIFDSKMKPISTYKDRPLYLADYLNTKKLTGKNEELARALAIRAEDEGNDGKRVKTVIARGAGITEVDGKLYLAGSSGGVPVIPHTHDLELALSPVIARLTDFQEQPVAPTVKALLELGDLYKYGDYIPTLVIGWGLAAPLAFVSRKHYNNFPFLVIAGEQNTGKSTLILSTVRHFGIKDEKGATALDTTFKMAQEANLGVPLVVNEAEKLFTDSNLRDQLKLWATQVLNRSSGRIIGGIVENKQYFALGTAAFTTNRMNWAENDEGAGLRSRVIPVNITKEETWASSNDARRLRFAELTKVGGDLDFNPSFGLAWEKFLLEKFPTTEALDKAHKPVSEALKKLIIGEDSDRRLNGYTLSFIALRLFCEFAKKHGVALEKSPGVPNWLAKFDGDENEALKVFSARATAALKENPASQEGEDFLSWILTKYESLENQKDSLTQKREGFTYDLPPQGELKDYLSGGLEIWVKEYNGKKTLYFGKEAARRYNWKGPGKLTLSKLEQEISRAYRAAGLADEQTTVKVGTYYIPDGDGKPKPPSAGTAHSIRLDFQTVQDIVNRAHNKRLNPE